MIYQERIKIDINSTLEELRKKVHEVEHKIYPMVLTKLFKKGE
ncbi:MAG: hypothetical protein ACRCZ0_12320 [Cetobacterium sp.]